MDKSALPMPSGLDKSQLAPEDLVCYAASRAYRAQGDMDGVQSALVAAWKASDATYGQYSSESGFLHHQLGAFFWTVRHRLDFAARHFEWAVAIKRRTNAEPRDLAFSLRSLATVHHQMGDEETAQRMMAEADAIDTRS
jgi:hypothetical protein